MASSIKKSRNVTEEVIPRGKNWTYLTNFTQVDGWVAQCNNIDSKIGEQHKPNAVILSNYGFDIPTNAVITKITVILKDRKLSYESDTDEKVFPNFGETSLSFVGCDATDTLKAKAPSVNFVEQEITIDNPKITLNEINSSDFGVKLQYTFNDSNNVGGIYTDYVKLRVTYETPSYNVSITEPRHKGTDRSWSTSDDPTIVDIGQECKTTVYFRSLNGYDGGVQTVRINFPINYKLLDVKPHTGELIVYEDKTYVDWVVSPPLDKVGGMCSAVSCDIKFTPRAFSGDSSQMVNATCLSTGQVATYFIFTSSEYNFEGDVFFVLPRLQRLTPQDEATEIIIQLSVKVPWVTYTDNMADFPAILKLWDIKNEQYVPFNLLEYTYDGGINHWAVIYSSNKLYDPRCQISDDYTTYNIGLDCMDTNSYDGTIATAISLFMYDFTGDEGEYEFRCFIPHDSEFQSYDMYSQSIYIEHETYYIGECSSENWLVHTPNLVTSGEGGGYCFECKTARGFQWHTRMGGVRCELEQRRRHIGGLYLPKSHYEPKLKFSNKVNHASYKNRAYYNKTGQWEHDLSLNIYLPKFHWKTLQEFVKMDKPVSIDTCPSCSDDDILNHRGWVEVEDISGVERVNGSWYKGEIGVKRITDKYYGKANIVKGNRVCSAKIPYTFVNIIDNGEYYLEYFELIGGGQLLYDKEQGIINEIIVPTGENLHLRSKWASKDIDDYKFNWSSTLPRDPTDEYNDYKYNSIVYSIINNLTGETVLAYTLYDFTNTDEVGRIVNTCKVSCTVWDNNRTPTVLFNKQIRLNYSQNDDWVYDSTTRLEFNASMVSITETGLSGQELMERNIQLPNGEYLLDICFSNNDVGLIEPDFVCHLNMDLKENIMANPLSNFYSDMLVSSFVIPNLNLLFYRYSEDGLLYYYYGDTNASFVVDGYTQYKGGVDLQTTNGTSILYVDNYTQNLYLNNGLCKIGFDRTFGLVSFYVYDYSHREWVYVNMLKIDDWTQFDIISINDDKAIVQFGETIWTMWRGHPFVQCEHIGTDLVINDEYDTIFSEAVVTSDGDIVYDGSYGKKEIYLFDEIVTPLLSVTGENAPFFISGDEVTFRCYLQNKYGDYIDNNVYPNDEEIGKMNFIVNDKTSYVDPTPQTDSRGRWYWEYTFTPPYANDDYQVYARFMPVGKFTEGISATKKYSVRKIATNMSVNGANSVNLSAETYSISFTLKDENNNALANQPIAIFEESAGRLDTIVTGNNGTATYTYTLETDGILDFYAIYDGTIRYERVKSATKQVTVRDDSKTDVTLVSAITVGNEGKVTLKFNGVSTGNVIVTVDGEDYEFGMNSSKVIQLSKSGTYNYVAKYQGDATHNKAVLKGSFTINKIASNISLSVSTQSINLGDKVSITISTTSDISNMPYTLFDNDSPVGSGTLTNGSKTIEYSPTYVGSHQFKVKYNGDTWRNSATSTTSTVTVQNTTTHIVHSNDAVYKNSKDYFRLLDADNNPVSGKQLKYTINGVTYNRTTDNNGYAEMNINLNPNTYPVHILFAGDNAHQTSSLDYNLQVKAYETVWKPAHSFASQPATRTAPYQRWNNLGFDGLDGTGYCTCGYSTNINEVIGTRSGTWNTPAKLSLYNFQFNIPSNAKIMELKVRVYERQYDRLSNGYPNIGNAIVSMANHDKRTCQSQPLKAKTGYNIQEVAWSSPNVTPSQLNDSSFAMGLEHGRNESATTGCLMLKYFEVGVSYAVETTKR